MFFTFRRFPSGPQTLGLLFESFFAPFSGSGAVLGSVFRPWGSILGGLRLHFWEPWGPLVPPGAVSGARRGAEAILEAKNWFIGPLLGSQNGAKMYKKMVEKSYQKSSDFSNAFLFDFC